MPWCPACDRFLAPPSVDPDGGCPTCHGPVEAGRRIPVDEAERPVEEEELGPVPLHLKILGVAMAVYLLWRLIQGIGWVVGKF